MAKTSGFFETRFLMAHEKSVLVEDIPLPGSRSMCLTFLSPFHFLVNFLVFAKIFSVKCLHEAFH